LICLPTAHIKQQPAHWRVYEQLDLDLTGDGEHVYFYVEKENMNTVDVTHLLAAALGIAAHEVGYAGLKDKCAITRQWFSAPVRQDEWPLFHERLTCLDIQRHTKKLRRGAHSANAFELTLTQCDANVQASLADMDGMFANFFGPQRVTPDNLRQARQWLESSGLGPRDVPEQGERRKPSRRRGKRKVAPRQGWHMSVLRSFLFNEVLRERVALGNHAHALAGDVLLNGVPSAPLWGRGRSATADEAAVIEQKALDPHSNLCASLEYTGVAQGRRVMAVQPQTFAASMERDNAVLSFSLPPGAYATVLLGQHLNIIDDSKNHG
jgi:tRNA pseudouridine13 synthase